MPLLKEKNLEEQIAKAKIQLQEIFIHLESMNREFDSFLDAFEMSSEEIHNYTHNQENFPQETWEKIKWEEKRLNDKLYLNLKNIKDPSKTKKVFSEKATIRPHWLFVR